MFRRNKYSYAYSSLGSSKKSYRRSNVRWDRVVPVSVITVVVLAILIAFNFDRLKLAFKGYSLSEQGEILEFTSDKINMITSQDKIDHISDWMKLSKQVKYYDEFEMYYTYHKDMKKKDIVETVTDIFDNYVPSLKELDYSNKQIWTVLKDASIEDLKSIIDNQYSYDTMRPYMRVKGFSYQDMGKYIKAYAKYNNYYYSVLYTTYPFIISKNKTTRSYTIQNPSSYTALVKKGFSLPASYTPKDLVVPADEYVANEKEGNEKDLSYYKLRKEAYNAFKQLATEAKKSNYTLLINSAYRSYDRQKEIYQEYTSKWGGLYAAQHVALPGTSEHQTGLGIDITSQSVVDGKRLVFGDTEEYKWVKANAYRYGIILRFADGTSDITGITQEPWHFRYVGKKAAKLCYENNWTLEEYVLNTGDLPEIK